MEQQPKKRKTREEAQLDKIAKLREQLAEQEKRLQEVKNAEIEKARLKRLETQSKVVVGALLQHAVVEGVAGALELFDRLVERAGAKDKERLTKLREILTAKAAARS